MVIVAITGGTGFIGRKLVLRSLAEGNTVRVLSRRPLEQANLPGAVRLYYGDLTDNPENLRLFVDGVDILYHCAAEVQDEARMQEVQVKGTQNLIAASCKAIGHWVQLSSAGVYGPIFRDNVTEQTPLNPSNLYEKTKAGSDRLLMDTVKKSSFTFSILRPSNVFGPTMTNQSLFRMIMAIDKKFFFFIGKSGASANYIHVDNVVEGLVRCGQMSAAKGRIYNLSDYRTMEEFVSAIAGELGGQYPHFRLPKLPVKLLAKICGKLSGFPLTESMVDALTKRSKYSTERIQLELGYEPIVSVEKGLHQMVDAWKQRKSERGRWNDLSN